MIRGINSSGRYITVNGSSSTQPYVNMSAPSAGMLRYNGLTQNTEVYDGTNWLTMNASNATIELNYDTERLLEWARTERQRQFDREQRIKENPALQKAYEAIVRAEENFNILEKFVEHDDVNTSSVSQGSP